MTQSSAAARAVGLLPSVGLGLSLLVLFTARQVLGPSETATMLGWVGAAGVLGAVGWRVLERTRAPASARPVETLIVLAYLGIVVAIGIYALQTEEGLKFLDIDPDDDSRLLGVLAVTWPALLLGSVFALIFMELAYARMPVIEAVEGRRVQGAALDGLSIALSLIFVVSVNYVAVKRDVRKDVSYFQTTRPSDATLGRVKALSEPIEVILLYPKVNDVLEQVRPYFEELDKASKQFKVTVRDHALSPKLVSQHRLRDNGYVVILKGEGHGQQAENFEVGVELEGARSRLKTLDGRFQEAFMRLTTRRRDLHLTAGHDERSRTGIDGDTARDRTKELDAALERSNITTRPLGMAQGLASEVPKGAPAVAVVGPRSPFLPEEAASLLRYVKSGGRLVVLVDPDVDHGLEPLLRGLGLELEAGVLASDRQFIRRDFGPSDRAIIRTSSYTAHPTVTVASRNAARLATVFIRGGALKRYQGSEVASGIKVVFPIRTGQFWLDLNNNYERDENEPLKQYNAMAAVAIPQKGGKEEGRAVIIADGDFITDQVIRNPGNALVFGDSMQWLLGEEQIVTETSSEEDRLIEHTTEEDKLWFWGTSFGVPLPILGLGMWITRRRRRSRVTRPASKARRAEGPEPEAEDHRAGTEQEETSDKSANDEPGGAK